MHKVNTPLEKFHIKFDTPKISKNEYEKIVLSLGEEELKKFTIDDLLNHPGLALAIKKQYPRIYRHTTSKLRELNLYSLIKMVKSYQDHMTQIINFQPYINENPPKNLEYAIEVLKHHKINSNVQMFLHGIPVKFEMSNFVKVYAKYKTKLEWRKTLRELGCSEGNINRIMQLPEIKFKT